MLRNYIADKATLHIIDKGHVIRRSKGPNLRFHLGKRAFKRKSL
jgi:hypothetical protein